MGPANMVTRDRTVRGKGHVRLEAVDAAAQKAGSSHPSTQTDLPDPALMGRMALSAMFENELAYCLKTIHSFASRQESLLSEQAHAPALCQSSPSQNTQRRLLVSQFRKCWEKFSPHLPTELIYTRMVEAGEQLLKVHGFHDVANAECFARFLDAAPSRFSTPIGPRPIPESRGMLALAAEQPERERGDEPKEEVPPGPGMKGNDPRSLRVRAQLGEAMCRYMDLVQVDPLLKSQRVVDQVLRVLNDVETIMEECAQSSDLAWLVYNGTFHVRTITDALCKAGWWAKALEPLLYSILCLSTSIPLINASSLTWLIDNMIAASQIYTHLHATIEAEQFLNHAMAKVQQIAAFERAALDGQPLDDTMQQIVDVASFKINLSLFGCAVRAVVAGRRIVNAEDVQLRAMAAVRDNAARYGGAAKRSSTYGHDFQRENSTARGSVYGGDDGRLWGGSVRGFGPRDSITENSRRPSVQSLHKIPSSLVFERRSSTTSHAVPSVVGGRGIFGSRTGLRNLTRQAANTFLRPVAKGMLQSNRPSMLEGGELDVPLEADEEGAPPDAPKKSKQVKAPKVAKPGYGLDDSEQGKAKRQMMFDIMHLLVQSFEDDRARFRAVVEGLHALCDSKVRLQWTEKAHDPFDRTHVISLALLDIGFDIVTSDPETAFSEFRIQEIFAHGGKIPSPPSQAHAQAQINKLIQDRRIMLLDLGDYMAFARRLFAHHQWDRFTMLTRLIDPIFSDSAYEGEFDTDMVEGYALELQLRSQIISFQNVLHAERKVGFGADVPPSSARSASSKPRRFDVPQQIASAVVSLLDSISACAENERLANDAPLLFVESAKVLYGFAEPYIRALTSVAGDDSEAGDNQFADMSADSTIVIALRSIHMILCGYPDEEVLFGVGIAGKLAMLLECMGDFEAAVEVLEETEERIRRTRYRFGEGTDGLMSVTCDVGFHADWKFGGNLDTLRTGKSEATTFILRELACSAVDIISALFRRRLKLQYSRAVREQKRKESEYFRLTKKRMPSSVIKFVPVEEEMRQACGDDPTLRSILSAVYASAGPNLNREEQTRLVKDAARHLQQAHKEERKLLDNMVGNDKTLTPPLRCPPPIFVRRTATSITIRPIPPIASSKNQSQVHHYQAFCKKVSGGGTATASISDVEHPGTGSPISSHPLAEITISNLTPGLRYCFAVVAYDVHGKIIGPGIGEPTKPILASFPLPLMLCWTYLAQVAHGVGCKEVADRAFQILWNHFIDSIPSESDLRRSDNYDSLDAIFAHRFKVSNLETSSAGAVRAFIQSIFAAVQRNFADTDALVLPDAEGRRDVLNPQLLRLRSCRDLLIALDLAHLIEDPRAELLAAVKCWSIMSPMLNVDTKPTTLFGSGTESRHSLPFIIHALATCHAAMIRTTNNATGEDRTRTTTDVFLPLAFQLTRRLVALQRPLTNQQAVRIAEESLRFVNAVTSTTDLRILNSSSLEQTWFGGAQRQKRAKNAKKGAAWAAEFVYHAALAVGDDPGKGYVDIRLGKTSMLCEYLECVIAIANATAWTSVNAFSQLTAGANPDFAGTAAAPRKTLDTNATAKEIFSVLIASGPEIAVQELSRFRKNPRYVELMARIANWCLKVPGGYDNAARVCVDVEEWADRRNLALLKMEELTLDDDNGKKESGIGKKRRRYMFADKRMALLGGSKEIRKGRDRGRMTTETTSVGKKKMRTRSNESLLDRPRSSSPKAIPITLNRPQSAGHSPADQKRVGRKSRSQERGESISSPAIISSKPRGRSPGAAPARRRSKARSRSRSRSPVDRSEDGVAPAKELDERGGKDGKVDPAALKKKRAAARQAFLAGLSPIERDTKDRATRTLDTVLSVFWKERRYARRLRIVLDYEAPFRAHVALVHGMSLYAHLDKEVTYRDQGGDIASGVETERFELQCAGSILLDELRIVPVDASNAADRPAAKLPPQQMTEISRLLNECFQAIVQSIVISARVGHWLQAMQAAQCLWTVTRQLMHRRCVHGTDFRRQNWWRAWWIGGSCLLDLLQGVKVRRADSEDLAGEALPPSRATTAGTAPGLATNASTSRPGSGAAPTKINSLPITDQRDLHSHQYVAGWMDRQGELQTMIINLPFFARFALFTIETMAVARKWHRLLDFGTQFNKMFNKIYGAELAPVFNKAREEIRNLGAKNAEDGRGGAGDLPSFARNPTRPALSELLRLSRTLGAVYYLEQKKRGYQLDQTIVDAYIAASSAYDNVYHVAKSRHAHDVLALACHEHADLMFEHGDAEGACLFWSKCVDALFKKEKTVAEWRSMFPPSATDSDEASCAKRILRAAGGAKNAFIAGIAAAKMARYFYVTRNQDKKSELVILAARLFAAPLRSTLPHPVQNLEFIHHVPTCVLPAVNLFEDRLRLDSTILSHCLLFVAQDLIELHTPLDSLPLASLVEHLSSEVCPSSTLLAAARLVKSEALFAAGFISQGFEKFLTISAGNALVAPDRKYVATPTVPQPSVQFNDHAQVLDPRNVRALRYLCDQAVLGERLAALYGRTFLQEYDLCRCKMVLKVLKSANLDDPGIADSHLSMILHKQDATLSASAADGGGSVGNSFHHLDILTRKSMSNLENGESEGSTKELSAAREPVPVAPPADPTPAPNTAEKSKQSALELGVLTNSVIPKVESVLTKLLAEAQADIQRTMSNTLTTASAGAMPTTARTTGKGAASLTREMGTAEEANTLLVLKCADQLVELEALRKNLDAASKWCNCISTTYSSLVTAPSVSKKLHIDQVPQSVSSPGLSMALGPTFWLRQRLQLASLLLAQGLFAESAYVAELGQKDAEMAHATQFGILFYGAMLIAQCQVPALKEAITSASIALQRMLNDVGTRAPDVILSKGWEILGDVLTATYPSDTTRISTAYEQATTILSRHVASQTRESELSGYSPHLPTLASIGFKHSLIILPTDPLSAIPIMQAAVRWAEKCVTFTPSFTIPMSLIRAKIRIVLLALVTNAEPRLRTEVSDFSRLLCTDLVSGVSGAGGVQYMVIADALGGLAALALEGLLKDSESENGVAGLVYHAARVMGIHKTVVDLRMAELEKVKMKGQEMPALLTKEFGGWAASQKGGAVLDDMLNGQDLLKPGTPNTNSGTGQGPTTVGSAGASQWKTRLFLEYFGFLTKSRPKHGRPPSNVWERVIEPRLKRVHAFLVEQIGAKYVSTLTATEFTSPNAPTSTPALIPGIHGIALPEDGASLLLVAMPTRRCDLDASHGCPPLQCLTLLLSVGSKKSVGRKSASQPQTDAPQQNEPAAHPSSGRLIQQREYDMPRVLVHCARVALEKVRAIERLLSEVIAKLRRWELTKDDMVWDEAVGKWESALTATKECFIDSEQDKDLSPPPLTLAVADQLHSLFVMDETNVPGIVGGGAVRCSDPNGASSMVFGYLGRLAASYQRRLIVRTMDRTLARESSLSEPTNAGGAEIAPPGSASSKVRRQGSVTSRDANAPSMERTPTIVLSSEGDAGQIGSQNGGSKGTKAGSTADKVGDAGSKGGDASLNGNQKRK